jgi:hypothetical protein
LKSAGKKSSLLLCLLILSMLLSACSSIFDKEYLSIKEATEQKASESGDIGYEVENYLELKLFLTRLVVEHSEVGKLSFKNYKGNVNEDLAAVCRDISSKMALGVYCVDFISYDIDRTVSRLGASVYVNYKKTKEETDAIKSMNTAEEGLGLIADAMQNGDELLVLHIRSSKLTEEDLRDFVEKKYLESPIKFPLRPGVLVGTYDSGDTSKIYEIRLDYGMDKSERIRLSSSCSREIKNLTEQFKDRSEGAKAMELISFIRESVEFDETAEGSLKNALIDKVSSSEGFPILLKACCDELGIESFVVKGRLNKSESYWNILKIEGEYYHFDIGRYKKTGQTAFLFASDEKMKGEYFWDFEEYPACSSKLQYENFSG